MESIRTLLGNTRVRLALVGFALIAAIAAVVIWRSGATLADLEGPWKSTEAYLKENPWALFLALIFLPALPIPTSALLFTAGVVWRDRPVVACAVCLLAMALNLSWTYWLAAKPGRGMVEKLLAAGSFKIPDLPRGDHLKLILIVRLTPGVPFFVQNYVLGFMRPPFFLYLPISLLTSGVIGIGIVLGGVGLADGRLLPALTGVSLIIVAAVFTHLIRGWLKGKRGNSERLKR